MPQSSVWGAFDRVTQGSQTPSADTSVSDSVEANHASVMQMIRIYVAELTIDRMSDPLKWWADKKWRQEDNYCWTVLVLTTN